VNGRILVVDDQQTIAHLLERSLASRGHDVRTAATGAEARAELERDPSEVVLLDLRLPDVRGLELLEEIRREWPDVAVVMITAYGDVETAVRAMKAGAVDYLTKPLNLEQVRLIVGKALEGRSIVRELGQHRSAQTHRLKGQLIRGNSPAFLEAVSIAERVATSTSTTVLLEGESGTGKQVLARLIHNLSVRRERPFIELNCAAIPSELLESELFGHERGAFTDAKSAKEGLLEAADGGTLFLDEIGEMPLPLQVKLLKVLETMTFRRVGGTRDVNVDVRVISATNRDLESRCRDGAFREDLYYRLKVVPLVVPPLRDRGEDVLVFARHFLESFSKQFGKRFRRLSREAESRLLAYRWPGNIRELRNLFERTVLLEDGETLEVRQLGLPEPTADDHSDVIARLDCLLRARDVPAEGIRLESLVDDVERELIILACELTRWNQSHAAELLGVGRDKLRYRMKRHEITRPKAKRPPVERRAA
jgi:DNA-binding NtrC family response regulator